MKHVGTRGKRMWAVVVLVALAVVAGALVGAAPVMAAEGEPTDWVGMAEKVLLLVVKLALPPLLVWALSQFKRWSQESADQRWYRVLQDVVRDAVAAAEQLGLSDELQDLAENKLDYAIHYVERALEAHGFPIDLHPYVDVIRGMIEAEVRRQFPNEQPAV